MKFLGLLVDPKLRFKNHIHKLCSKLSQIAGMIGGAKHYLNQTQMMLLYNTLVLPHLTYCSLIWGINYPSNLDRIIILQKRIARNILHLNFRESVLHRFGKIQMLTIHSLVKYRAILFAHKHLNNNVPSSLRDILVLSEAVVSTRNTDLFNIPFTKVVYRKHTVRHFVPTVWNELSQCCDLHPTLSISTIKKRTKNYLYENQ